VTEKLDDLLTIEDHGIRGIGLTDERVKALARSHRDLRLRVALKGSSVHPGVCSCADCRWAKLVERQAGIIKRLKGDVAKLRGFILEDKDGGLTAGILGVWTRKKTETFAKHLLGEAWFLKHDDEARRVKP